MKIAVIFLFVITLTHTAMAQAGSEFKLPKTWEKDFVVTVSHTGSMSGGESLIRVTYDSLIYTSSSRKSGKEEKKIYRMKEPDRVALLAKLYEFGLDKIKPESHMAAVSDGWQHSICMSFHCIEGGTSVELKEKDKNNFLSASAAIEDFAIKKAR